MCLCNCTLLVTYPLSGRFRCVIVQVTAKMFHWSSMMNTDMTITVVQSFPGHDVF